MLTLAVFIVVLGLLVFVHEFGHFIVAKRAGVRVEIFSFGFGPRLLGVKRGDTEYRISALPLGGYVKMTGEDPQDAEAQSEYSFTMKPVSARMRIVVAGPVMNLLLPLFLMPIVYLLGIQQPAYLDEPPAVGWVEEESTAEKAGFHVGDTILSIQGDPTPTWEKVKILFASNPNKALSVEILRADTHLQLTITPESKEALGGYTGLLQKMAPLIDSVEPNLPAAKAGLQRGDKIISIQGAAIHHWVQMAKIIRAHPGEPLEFTILRGGESFTQIMEPKKEEESGTGILGITHLEETTFKRYGLLQSIRSGLSDFVQSIQLTFYVIGKLFTGNISVKTLGGPILIAKMTGDAARVGLSSLISFVAFLSLQLGILNLFPIPVLDGGHIFFFCLEGLLRRPLNVKIREVAQQVGFIVLLIFILVISYNDVMRILPIHIERLFK